MLTQDERARIQRCGFKKPLFRARSLHSLGFKASRIRQGMGKSGFSRTLPLVSREWKNGSNSS